MLPILAERNRAEPLLMLARPDTGKPGARAESLIV